MKAQRHFTRGEPKRVGNVVIIASMLLSLLFLSLIKSRYCASPSHVRTDAHLNSGLNANEVVRNEKTHSTDSTVEEDEDEEVQINPAALGTVSLADINNKPICFVPTKRSETCDARGDIRVKGSTNTIYIPTITQEHKIKPYARKHDEVALSYVKEWTLKPSTGDQALPKCTQKHSVPAMLFSSNGFTGNLFHDYTDVLVPLFINTYPFHGEVKLVVSQIKSWWINKFILVFKQLTNYDIIDVENDDEVHCFPRVIAGPTYHKELGVEPSKTPTGFSILEFKRMLRTAFKLERAEVVPTSKPKLLIISRKTSRRFMNLKTMIGAAEKLGFEVKTAEADMHTDPPTFARLVNSVDVMLGVHGAGLTNMVFLPVGAVVIQFVPYGNLEWLTKETFKDPAPDMGIHYMDYFVQLNESTLSEQYPKDHPVLKDPTAVHTQGGWDALKSIYLDKQNIRPDIEKFKKMLVEALRLIRSKKKHHVQMN
ncbi:EGF domain-specific O-linked N-acetylglucosamine transferase-like protein [Carex littledalei]|uniref:EGF domain-specific O-linked N-acetylglucosamine transferase-like protein n=1 Tax=Carex littledalei TaxID=544730 RepID=A0A833VYH0_9POAL|nr:EGF domain-specific O-linked N-acetylglucosamine transferase-like protein [Carex littledalei]